jgi:primosomal protein N' (replication factor Y)
MEKPGKVIIQTHHPDHPLLHQLFKENYEQFAKSILQERVTASLPPCAFFALFRAEAHKLDYATDFLQQVKRLIPTQAKHLHVWGPIPATMPKRAGRYRVQLLLQSPHRSSLQRSLKSLILAVEKISTKNRVRWSLDVDPMEMF